MTVRAQFDTIPQYSIGGWFEYVFDDEGNKIPLAQVMVRPELIAQIAQMPVTCEAGYFKLHFMPGSGMDEDNAIHAERRNTVCQVFSDLSAFIASPLQQGSNTNFVNIRISDSEPLSLPPFIAPNFPLGGASAYYLVPFSDNPIFGGIADGLVWQTILSGQDPYVTTGILLDTPGNPNSGSGFYHGRLLLNFINYDWNADLSIDIGVPDTYDLYTVTLHEAMHMLGITTLIDGEIADGGVSRFGPGYNYYSRFDTFLKTQNGGSLIVSNGATPMYDWPMIHRLMLLTRHVQQGL